MTDQPSHGSLAEEFAKLAAVLSERLQSSTTPKPHPGDRSFGTESAVPAACEVCPICQLIALVRGQRTESVDKLLGSAVTLMAALTDHLQQPESAPPEPADPSTASQQQTSRVFRINVE